MRQASNHTDILHLGPVVEARIFPDERTFMKQKEEPRTTIMSKRVRMLIDTGANISALHIDIIERLQLPHYRDKATVEAAGGRISLNRYRCILHLPAFGKKGLPIDVLEGSFEDSPYEGVIGRDVLRFCKLTYDGVENSFRLTAPGF